MIKTLPLAKTVSRVQMTHWYSVSPLINTYSWKIEGTESEYQKCHIKICKYLSGIAKDCFESNNFTMFENHEESIRVTLLRIGQNKRVRDSQDTLR